MERVALFLTLIALVPAHASEAAPQERSGLGAVATFGLCLDLAEMLALTEPESPGIDGALSCTSGFGVDYVSFSGFVTAGVPYAPAREAPTAIVFWREPVGVMHAEMVGASARKLYDAMPVPVNGDELKEKVSPRGRVRCTVPAEGEPRCLVTGMVGFRSGG